MGNEKIINLLTKLELYYTIIGDHFRTRAYNLAISAVRNYPGEIKTKEEAMRIYNIGKGSIAEKIGQLLNGKSIEKIIPAEILAKIKLYKKLMKIQGFGFKGSKKIIKEFNLKSFDEFLNLVKTGKIELTHEQQIGIKYRKDLTTPIEHAEMQKLATFLKSIAKEVDNKLRVEMVGSFRRKRPFSNDIDLLLSHPDVVNFQNLANLKRNYALEFYHLLETRGIIVDYFKNGSLGKKTKKQKLLSAEFVIKGPYSAVKHKVDMKMYPMENYPTALLYFTGSKDFNERLRRIAKRKGFKLSDFELVTSKANDIIKVNSEEDIFKALGQKYVSPENR
jgi:DNA polymerase/3'-5' exonuclease PolX